MLTLALIIAGLAGFMALAMRRAPLWQWAVAPGLSLQLEALQRVDAGRPCAWAGAGVVPKLVLKGNMG